MAGIYIHIPFCSEKCYYCDFYSGNQLYLIDNYVDALIQELQVRKDYLNNEAVNSIYFGGGTPSLLSVNQVNIILNTISSNFKLSNNPEITLECNPENISAEYVRSLAETGVNRLSLGVQFLDDTILAQFNRKHSKYQITNAIEIINNSKITNLSVDIIFGVPGISDQYLQSSLTELLTYDIKHFSAYSLSVSKGSRLFWKVRSGEFEEMNEEGFISQYTIIHTSLVSNGFGQYEVSNYARKGFLSKHNLSYWNQEPYLGVGVSAHSYNIVSRQWNLTNSKKYIRDLAAGNYSQLYQVEQLTDIQCYNEYIILRLRTFEGISAGFIETNFSREIISHFTLKINSLRKKGHFTVKNDMIFPTDNDLLLSDYLAKILMF